MAVNMYTLTFSYPGATDDARGFFVSAGSAVSVLEVLRREPAAVECPLAWEPNRALYAVAPPRNMVERVARDRDLE
jgi:hypothetical protein